MNSCRISIIQLNGLIFQLLPLKLSVKCNKARGGPGLASPATASAHKNPRLSGGGSDLDCGPYDTILELFSH
jgi:hypothetical protein